MEPRFQSSINPAEYTRQVNVTSPSLPPATLVPDQSRDTPGRVSCGNPTFTCLPPPPLPPLFVPSFFKLTEPPSPSSSSSLHRCRIWRDKPRYLAPTLLTSVSSTTTGGEDDDDDDVRDAVSARTLEERAGGYVSGTLNWIEFAMVSFFLPFSSNTLFKKRLKSVV